MTAESSLHTRLLRVRERVADAAERAGREEDEVEILPVTKGHPAGALRDVADSGIPMVGENRVGEAESKRAEIGSLGLRWHMVGHLQRNKADRAVRLFDVLESLDSIRLARRLDRALEKAGRDSLEVLVQVNASGEETKGGFGPDETVDEVGKVCTFARLRVTGLMTMAPLTSDEATLRSTFRTARRLFERCGAAVPGFEAAVLSMGMSNDFEIAVEEGSTRLRLGTSLLGERQGTEK